MRASAHDWEVRFNRRVKEDARPLFIPWPFAPVVTVYDVLDTFDPQNPATEGLPENIASFFSADEITAARLRSLPALLARKNIELRRRDRGDASAERSRSSTVRKTTRTRTISHSEVEIEAESVAYLVCERNGVKAKPQSYLSHFVDAGVTADSLDLYHVMRAAGQVEGILNLTMHTKFPR